MRALDHALSLVGGETLLRRLVRRTSDAESRARSREALLPRLTTAVAMGLSKEDGVTRGAIQSVPALNAILLSMFLAYSDADVLAQANRESKQRGSVACRGPSPR